MIIGIDVGMQGAIAGITDEGNCVFRFVTPTIGPEIDWDKFRKYLTEPVPRHVFIELVHAIHGSSAKATFKFGGCFEGCKAILAGLNVPYTLVQPKVWQKMMYVGVQEIRKPNVLIKVGKHAGSSKKGNRDTKAMSLIAVKRLFGYVDLKRTPACEGPHDGIVDALLIAEYGRRMLCHQQKT